VHVYAGEYKYFPPNNPAPRWWPQDEMPNPDQDGWDPSIGFLMTYAMRMNPPEIFDNGHFSWVPLNEDELPEIVVCPSARREQLFVLNKELDENNPLEAMLYQYAAFYQTSGTCRAPIPSRDHPSGRNPAVPHPGNGSVRVNNQQWGLPIVYVQRHTGPYDQAGSEGEYASPIQAIEPSEIDDPGRVYYLADSREYRPEDGAYPAAGQNDGWRVGFGNQVFMSARHNNVSNIVYMDGHVSSDNHDYDDRWRMSSGSDQYRVSTFGDPVDLAGIVTQHHIMPQMSVRGWEYFFKGR
jgi:prepilin-type processing-associated H-X9-DG protein